MRFHLPIAGLLVAVVCSCAPIEPGDACTVDDDCGEAMGCAMAEGEAFGACSEFEAPQAGPLQHNRGLECYTCHA